MEPLRKARYILIANSLIAMFTNLTSCFVASAPVNEYLESVFLLLITILCFIFITNDKVVPISFLIMGLITMAYNVPIDKQPSWSIILLLYGLSYFKHILIYSIVYGYTFLITVIVSTTNNLDLSSTFNIIVVYTMLYSIHFIVRDYLYKLITKLRSTPGE